MDDSYGPYGQDWGAAAEAGARGVIWLGEIPLDRARELVEQGWNVIGQPLPPFASTDEIPPGNVDITPRVPPATDTDVEGVQGAGPPIHIEPGPPPLDEGGPEESAPPADFDFPLPTEPPQGQFPVSVPPPLEGEMVGPDVIYHDYEGYDQLPGFGEYPTPPRRIIEGEVSKRETPPWWLGPAARQLGRVILGPYGSMAGQVIEAGMPEVLGSGYGIDEILLPRVPMPEIPVPQVQPQFPELGLPSPAPAEFPLPEPPEVITVTPQGDPLAMPIPSPANMPKTPRPRGVWPFLGALAPILRPIHRSRAGPGLGIGAMTATPPEFNMPQPLPTVRPDPLTPPRIPGTDPLTPPRVTPVTSTQTAPFGPLQMFTPTQEDQDDRCRCRENKHEPDPSDTVANVKVYRRRMSNWSLRNLNRGTKAAKLLKEFL